MSANLRTARNVALAVVVAALLPFGLQAGLAGAQSGSGDPTESGSPSDSGSGRFEGTARVSGADRSATAVAISQYWSPMFVRTV